MCILLFFVFSISRFSFAIVSDGMECNNEGLVLVWNWVYSGSSYAVWNCKSHSVVKLVVLSCCDVAWVVFVVFSLYRSSFVTVSAGMEYNK